MYKSVLLYLLKMLTISITLKFLLNDNMSDEDIIYSSIMITCLMYTIKIILKEKEYFETITPTPTEILESSPKYMDKRMTDLLSYQSEDILSELKLNKSDDYDSAYNYNYEFSNPEVGSEIDYEVNQNQSGFYIY